jgi:ceramide glucosyltransferase
MYLFYFFAAIVVGLGILSFRSGIRFAKYVRSYADRAALERETASPLPDFAPFVSVIAPCRGVDQGLRENLLALCQQNYPAYEILFVIDRKDDPSLCVIEKVNDSESGVNDIRVRIIVAGEATDSGQKVHNLRVAAQEVAPNSRVLVFVDSDARPQKNWLRLLVAPLRDEQLGAATGYRWFIPVIGGFASHLCSVWNASITSALGEHEDKNFCWGGSTAIRRETFEKLQIEDRWRGTVSDDFTMTQALREANLPICFVPTCLVPSLEDCSFRELVEFTTRQLKITRVYAPHLWKAVLLSSLLFSFVFFGGLALVVARAALGMTFMWPVALLCIILTLGTAKAAVRWRAVSNLLAQYRTEMSSGLSAHLLFWPLASVLYLYNALAATFSRRIEWRGITYELKSANEAVIISRVS